MDELREKALAYHCLEGRPGKLEVIPAKPCRTAADLSLTYTPGVAKPVLEIDKNPREAYAYTNTGNHVAVVSNGTAISGLGDRGALASKPVMEGKGILVKRFADVDVFDLEIDTKDPEKSIEVVKLLEPAFDGVNLEAMEGADVFIGLSVADCVPSGMLLSMADNPVVFAMSNPDPGIPYPLAVKTRKDVIMATGRSDYPNQINNVLGFPFIFRGAFDVRASDITEGMKMAAA